MQGSNSLHHSSPTRRSIPWATLVTLVAAVALLSTAILAGPVECTSLPLKEDPSSTSTAAGLIGCMSHDASSSSSSSPSIDSLSSSLSSLPIPSHSLVHHNNKNNKDNTLLPCPSCTDNRPASPLPSTGSGHPRRPSSLAPSRFSTNRLPLHFNTLPSCPDTTTAGDKNNNSDNCDICNNSATTSSHTAITMSPVSSTSSPPSRPLSPAPQHTLHQQQQPLFPEPIVFQYVLYYPGNLPLVITAGHGGSAQPGEVLSRKKTHRLRRIPNLATVTDPIEISSFAEPLYPPSSSSSPSQSCPTAANLNNSDEIMPSMMPRDQTKPGNFKKDLNTHSIALNLANAISCLTSGVGGGGGGASFGSGGAIGVTPDGTSGSNGPFSIRTRVAAREGKVYGETGSDNVARMIETMAPSVTATASTTHHETNTIPARCEQQGPWGDDDSDYPFPTWTSLASTPAPTPAPTPTLPLPVQHHQQPLDLTRRFHQKQAQNYPHVIVFRIPRRFVDVNRNITGENAIADGDVHAEAAWREYHDLIDHVQKMALQKAAISINHHQQQEQEQEQEPKCHKQQQPNHWTPPQALAPGRGLLLDIHGHAHATNLIEIGYLLNGTVLNMDDDRLNAYAAQLTKEPSIRSLINKVVFNAPPPADSLAVPQPRLPFSKLIRGGKTESLGGMFQAQGLNAVPSPDFQAPCQECVYFFGGYTIQSHGSHDHKDSDLANNDTMDAIQLELPKILRLVDKEQGREVGMKLGRAVVEFAAQYYGLFRENLAVAAREQPDATVMAAMARGTLSSRSGSSTPRRSGATGSGRGGGRTGAAGSNGNGAGGMTGQMAHSTRLQERLARVHHSHDRAPQQQHLHNHQPQQQQHMQLGADHSVAVALSNNPSDGWDQQSGDSNQSGDSEMENDRDRRRPEIKRQASRL